MLGDEQPCHGMRRHQIDLEACAGRDLAGVTRGAEGGVGCRGDARIEQIVELHIRHRLAGLQRVAPAWRGGFVQAEHLVGELQGRVVGENRLQPDDPVATLAGFAIGDAFQSRTERSADLVEHFFGAGHRHAADEVEIMTRHRQFLF